MGGGIIKVGNYLYSHYWANPQIHDTVPMRDEYLLEGDVKDWVENTRGFLELASGSMGLSRWMQITRVVR